MVFVFNSCPGLGVIQLHVGLVGNVGVHGVADSGNSKWWCHELHGRGCGAGCSGTDVVGLGFHFRDGLFAVAYRGRDVWMMLWLAAACFVEAAFIFSACLLPGTNLLGVGSRHGSPHVGR